ncbi:uncharacterized protein KGF55_005427 [Candida pseudojiufengensis]|uniref:uncharacterized protein n=1 Tax=Candida pseudojiufengensis TaxID=497109 RepID=UPI002224E9E1|nr:uncharacterized protein KGF55_005427 [Candida pseudojiufengensis]KAI5959277.1 hypothetical protein KGF55_005427 [Candida pseudojiufengensis]
MTKPDLKALIRSFNDATQYWVNILNSKEINKVTPSKIEKPLDELLKLIKLIKAHTTKVGIIFKPETLQKQEQTAYNTLESLSESLVFTVSVLSQLNNDKNNSNIYYQEILDQNRLLIESNVDLSTELMHIYEDKTDEGRLVSIGKIWSNCDSIISLLENGALSLLTNKIKLSISLIDDGFDEFSEWAKNPEEVDDTFGFSDEEDDENEDEESLSEEDLNKLIEYSGKWVKKIELVKLLIASFKKSLPKSTTNSQIDDIYDLQKNITILIDKFIVELMLNRCSSKEIDTITNDISKNSITLAKLAESIHNDKKSTWYSTWIIKYD